MRAARGSSISRMGRNGTKRRGGFLMGCGDGARARAADPSAKSSNAPSSVAFDTPSSVAFDARSSLAFDLPRGAFSRRGVALMEARITAIMKIMIFPVNIEKFTMFFDKFLKNDGQIKHCNKKSYHVNLSVAHSDIAAKKVFRLPRICPRLPAFARICPQRRPPDRPPPASPRRVASGGACGV